MKSCKLVFFSEDIYVSKKGKRIYLIGSAKSCILELCKTYDVLDGITGLIDGDLYVWYRSMAIGNRVVDILDDKYINLLNGDETIIILGGDYIAKSKKMINIYNLDDKFEEIYYFPGREGMYMHSFLKKNDDLSLKNIIIFRSGSNANDKFNDWEYADNSRALFEYMLMNDYDNKYKLVWMAREPHKYIDRMTSIKKKSNIVLLSYDDAFSDNIETRDKYYYHLCFAKFVFFCQSYMFARNLREDQIRIQLWHGCGFKSNFNKEEYLRYEYMTVSSDMYAKLHAKSFELDEKQMLVTGLPKNDWLFNPLESWLNVFNLSKSSKYIFWLPTYRTKTTYDRYLTEVMLNQETGLPILKSKNMITQLNAILKALDIILIIKLHPSQDRSDIISLNFSNIVLIDNITFIREKIDINQILGHADALISDYSSAAVGYMLLDRPIAFTLDDIDLYHGFHWPKEELRNWLPGEEIYDYDDFVSFIKDVKGGRDNSREKRHRLMPFFHKYTDGNSCERVLKALGITKD